MLSMAHTQKHPASSNVNVFESIISLISFLVIVGESTVGVGTCATVDGSTSGDDSVSPCVVDHSLLQSGISFALRRLRVLWN